MYTVIYRNNKKLDYPPVMMEFNIPRLTKRQFDIINMELEVEAWVLKGDGDQSFTADIYFDKKMEEAGMDPMPGNLQISTDVWQDGSRVLMRTHTNGTTLRYKVMAE